VIILTDLKAILIKQIDIEQKAIDSIKEAIDVSKNTTWKLLLSSMLLDSTKHKEICRALIDLISGKAVHLIEKVRMEKLAREHLSLEQDALRNIREAIKNTKFENVKALLQLIESYEGKSL